MAVFDIVCHFSKLELFQRSFPMWIGVEMGQVWSVEL